MKKQRVHFYTFLVLFLLTLLLPVEIVSMELATSVVPGWHTTIYPPYFLMNIIVSLILLIVTIAYRKLARRNASVSTGVFLTHLALTIPVVFYIIYPEPLEQWLGMLVERFNPESVVAIIIVFLSPYLLFILGLLLFYSTYNKRGRI